MKRILRAPIFLEDIPDIYPPDNRLLVMGCYGVLVGMENCLKSYLMTKMRLTKIRTGSSSSHNLNMQWGVCGKDVPTSISSLSLDAAMYRFVPWYGAEQGKESINSMSGKYAVSSYEQNLYLKGEKAHW